MVFNRVLDESKKIDAFFNERDKDYSDMIKTLASEVRKYISLFQGPSRLRTLWGQWQNLSLKPLSVHLLVER